MANGVQVNNARVIFTQGTDAQTFLITFNSPSSGSTQVGSVVNIPLATWTNLYTQSLADIRWAAFTNEGPTGSIAVRISGSTTDLTYLKSQYDSSLISLQSGSNPQLMAISYISASVLNYKLQGS